MASKPQKPTIASLQNESRLLKRQLNSANSNATVYTNLWTREQRRCQLLQSALTNVTNALAQSQQAANISTVEPDMEVPF